LIEILFTVNSQITVELLDTVLAAIHNQTLTRSRCDYQGSMNFISNAGRLQAERSDRVLLVAVVSMASGSVIFVYGPFKISGAASEVA